MINLSQDQKQLQKLKMTYLMQRSLKILQMPNIELCEYIENEILKNPLLEIIQVPQNTQISHQSDCKAALHDIPHKISLYDHLKKQAKEIFRNFDDFLVAQQIIGDLDEFGYFDQNIDEIQKKTKCTQKKVEEILKKIKTFDPAGIAAKNLKERILLQIENKKSLEFEIFENFFDEVHLKKFSKIAQKTKQSSLLIKKTIEDCLKKVKLNPTEKFNQNSVNIFTFDILIKHENQKWIIEINENIPSFTINQKYSKILKENSLKLFENASFSAKFLMKNILKRRKLLLDISKYLIKKNQKFFLNKNDLILIPMKDLANELSVNISTIARAIKDKYIQCPNGTFLLKTFFSKKFENLPSIIKSLKKIIENENKEKPLNDLEICQKLKEKGFFIERRTVAKYRKMLFIEPSYKRS